MPNYGPFLSNAEEACFQELFEYCKKLKIEIPEQGLKWYAVGSLACTKFKDHITKMKNVEAMILNFRNEGNLYIYTRYLSVTCYRYETELTQVFFSQNKKKSVIFL